MILSFLTREIINTKIKKTILDSHPINHKSKSAYICFLLSEGVLQFVRLGIWSIYLAENHLM